MKTKTDLGGTQKGKNHTMENHYSTTDDELALLNYAMEYPEESDTVNGCIYDGYGPAFDLADE